MKKLKPLFAILTAALILFSAVCFLYPAISNAINEQYNESRIDDYNNNVDSISREDLDDYFSVAEKYNKALATDISADDSNMSNALRVDGEQGLRLLLQHDCLVL